MEAGEQLSDEDNDNCDANNQVASALDDHHNCSQQQSLNDAYDWSFVSA